jgi:hypothetical protein
LKIAEKRIIMASLNREFLVPYLQNVCSLHLALRKVEQKIRKINYLIFEAENGVTVEKPQRREHVVEKNRTYYAVTAIGCVVSVFSGMFFALNIIGGTQIGLPWTVAGMAVGILLLVLPQLVANAHREQNRKIDQEFDREFDRYRAELAEAVEKSAHTVSKLKLRLQEWEQEKRRVDELLQMAYSANLIPMPYRNIYSALYLYEWICTSRLDDLNVALLTFDIEKCREKLNHIILTQSDAVLFHTKSVADQSKTFVAQKQQEVIMRSKLETMGCVGEERELYETVLEVNLDATAYFAAADYLLQI